MESESELPTISKEFLSKLLKQPVKSFTLKPGTNIGDNYMSVLYTITAEIGEENENKTVTLLSKCFPTHPARQQFMKMSNVFYNELKIYDTFIPTLQKFASENGIEGKLPFSPLVGGEAVDFITAKRNGDTTYENKLFGSFDIFIMMPDLRAQNFRMANRQVGLDYDHVKLVMKAHAKFHSLSWAYKQKNGLESLVKTFPFMDFEMSETDTEMFVNVMVQSVQQTLGVMKPDSEIHKRTKVFQDRIGDMVRNAFVKNTMLNLAEYHREKPDASGEEWRVALHGDCWVNNLLFRYDEKTNLKPEEIVLVDLQMVRESCPTADMVYLLYSSTDTEFRKKYLNEMLELYHDEFLRNCKTIGVKPLPGFSLHELKRRFHISKILGYCMAIMVTPIMMKDAGDIQDMEKMEQNNGMEEMFNFMMDNIHDKSNNRFQVRIVNMAQELYDEGVL